MTEEVIRKGGSSFIEDVPAAEVFTPEDFREEHKMIITTAEDFVTNEVAPHLEEVEHKDFELTRQLMRKAGELGLLGADVEEKYGGTELDSIASLLIMEHSVASGSFAVAMNAHTGIGTMPLALFGNAAQKEKYLPALVRGEKVGCYALTEPEAGTDALSIRTTAVLSPDGKYYRLNGAKQFITNAGFADIIFTYAKVDGDKFTCFLLEKDFEGISLGPEEKKMGIRGTSTTSIILENAKVPVENVIFEIGRGHVVAFNILDLGRFKLAAGSVGAAKLALAESARYAKERVQFGKPIGQFGLIKHKLAEMATRTYMAESMVYRTGGLVDTVMASVDRTAKDAGAQSAKSISEYAVECSINKVYCSEMLALVADEAVQIFGGYGYIEDYPVERMYRDCRIFRIFEGTNEINRLITIGWLMRRALKNEIPFFSVAQEAQNQFPTLEPVPPEADGGPLGYQRHLVGRVKKVFQCLSNMAAQKYGLGLEEEQEIIALLSNIAMEVYAMESGLLRAVKSIEANGEQASELKVDMVRVYVNDAIARVYGHAREALAAMHGGEELDNHLSALGRALHYTPVNTVETRRRIADRILEAEKFIC
ncbi:MAG: acyl-CoA dehydrogenase [Chloroflexi bacterium]|nr:MAG: acyl-CoA dehydrogenase [Chloroflexota bacterium]